MTGDHRSPRARAAGRARNELERLLDARFTPGQSVLVGLGFAWAAIALKAGLNEGLSEETGYIVLMAGAVLAAWFSGTIGGLTAVATALLLNGVIFLGGPAPDAASVERFNQIRQVLYLVVSTGTVLLVAWRRAARDRLADALDEVATLADEVAERDERLEMMLSAAGTGFWEWDVRSRSLTWSDEVFRQAGMEPGGPAPTSDTFLAMVHPEDRAAVQAAVDEAVAAGEGFELSFRFVWSDGSTHWTNVAGRVLRDQDGTAVRLLGTSQDITERRRLEAERTSLLEEERRAREFREAFIDVISHELRTPITTILGLTQILTRPGRADEPAARTAMLEDVRAESERLHRLVEDLLVLSRMERGRLVADPEPLALPRLLRRLIAHEAAELPTLDIELDMPPDLPIVLGEATYVEQIVRNLLGNAAKYTPPGTHVVVRARHAEDDVEIRVQDDGPGVPPESQARLFELFYRDPHSARTAAGSGIGLFVCASLAEAMGGRIWVAEAPGGGAEIGFTLRRADVDDLEHERIGPEPGDRPAATSDRPASEDSPEPDDRPAVTGDLPVEASDRSLSPEPAPSDRAR